MVIELIKDKVYYKIFDKTYRDSTGIYSFYKYDDAAKLAEVQENINTVKSVFDAKNILILKQVHGNQVIDADALDLFTEPEADASVTTKQNIILSVLTADCVPVLFASDDGRVVAAAHCGWRSAKADIINKVRNLMNQKGASYINAIIGPAIAQKSYEVDFNFYKSFVDEDLSSEYLFIPSQKENHFMFDLVGFVEKKLLQENINLVHRIADDTYSLPDKYPSYRRSCHHGTVYSQNILSTIVIK